MKKSVIVIFQNIVKNILNEEFFKNEVLPAVVKFRSIKVLLLAR